MCVINENLIIKKKTVGTVTTDVTVLINSGAGLDIPAGVTLTLEEGVSLMIQETADVDIDGTIIVKKGATLSIVEVPSDKDDYGTPSVDEDGIPDGVFVPGVRINDGGIVTVNGSFSATSILVKEGAGLDIASIPADGSLPDGDPLKDGAVAQVVADSKISIEEGATLSVNALLYSEAATPAATTLTVNGALDENAYSDKIMVVGTDTPSNDISKLTDLDFAVVGSESQVLYKKTQVPNSSPVEHTYDATTFTALKLGVWGTVDSDNSITTALGTAPTVEGEDYYPSAGSQDPATDLSITGETLIAPQNGTEATVLTLTNGNLTIGNGGSYTGTVTSGDENITVVDVKDGLTITNQLYVEGTGGAAVVTAYATIVTGIPGENHDATDNTKKLSSVALAGKQVTIGTAGFDGTNLGALTVPAGLVLKVAGELTLPDAFVLDGTILMDSKATTTVVAITTATVSETGEILFKEGTTSKFNVSKDLIVYGELTIPEGITLAEAFKGSNGSAAAKVVSFYIGEDVYCTVIADATDGTVEFTDITYTLKGEERSDWYPTTEGQDDALTGEVIKGTNNKVYAYILNVYYVFWIIGEECFETTELDEKDSIPDAPTGDLTGKGVIGWSAAIKLGDSKDYVRNAILEGSTSGEPEAASKVIAGLSVVEETAYVMLSSLEDGKYVDSGKITVSYYHLVEKTVFGLTKVVAEKVTMTATIDVINTEFDSMVLIPFTLPADAVSVYVDYAGDNGSVDTSALISC